MFVFTYLLTYFPFNGANDVLCTVKQERDSSSAVVSKCK